MKLLYKMKYRLFRKVITMLLVFTIIISNTNNVLAEAFPMKEMDQTAIITTDLQYTLNDEKTSAVITLNVDGNSNNIVIMGIELPNGIKSSESVVEYQTMENGVYSFTVFYDQIIKEEITTGSAVTMFDGLTKIETGAFSENNLTEVYIPDSVNSIGWTAFFKNNLEKIHIPEGLESIEYGVFSANFSLKEVHIPDSVKHIDEAAF